MKLWAPCAAAAALLSLPLLAGCGAALSSIEPIAPIAPISPGTTAIGHLQGNVYGGGVPVTGAKIFLYTASTAGYGITPAGAAGSRSTSLLNTSNSTSNGTKDTVTTDITYGDYYVLTDSNGDFNISGDYTCTPGTQLYLVSIGGNPGYGGTNSAVGLMTALPQCPSTGTLVGTGISFIYMNEVSTVAAAYAVAGFAHDPVHIGAPTGPPSAPTDALALTGIKNAFANAGNLYNFGPVTAGGSALASSTGIIRPQATVDTLANILQHCVNTFDASTTMPSGISAACTNLFATGGAGNTGKTTGSGTTVATADTATAAIFIAQHPGTNVATLFGYAVTSGTAYLPKLASTPIPNDLSVQLLFSGGGMVSTFAGKNNAGDNTFYNAPRSLAIDSAGNAWVAGVVSTKVSVFSPLGVPLSSTGYTTGTDANSVAIDASGYAWVAAIGSDTAATSKVYKLYATNAGAATGTLAGTFSSGGIEPTDAEIDASGNVWVSNFVNSSNSAYGALVEMGPTGTITNTYDSTSANANKGNTGSDELYKPGGVGIAPTGQIWAVDGAAAAANTYTSIFSNADVPYAYFGTFTYAPLSGSIVFDASGNAWVTEGSTNATQITPGFAGTEVALGKTQHYTATPEAIVADGNSNMWVTDFDNGTIYEINASAAVVSPAYGYPTPGNTGYTGTPTITYADDSIAVDGSGNVWYSAASTTTNYLGEIIGIATPVATPIAYGLANSKLGTRP